MKPVALSLRFSKHKLVGKCAPMHLETGMLVMVLKREGTQTIVASEILGRTHMDRVASDALVPIAAPRPGSLCDNRFSDVRDDFVAQALKVMKASEPRG